MNIKKLFGIGIFAVGLILILVAFQKSQRFAEEKDFGQGISNFFTHNPMWNPMIKYFGGTPQEKLPDYDPSAPYYFWTGIILVIGGTAVLVISRKEKR
jgi:hypothetical protein